MVALLAYALQPLTYGGEALQIETAFVGQKVTRVLEGQAAFDLLVRLMLLVRAVRRLSVGVLKVLVEHLHDQILIQIRLVNRPQR